MKKIEKINNTIFRQVVGREIEGKIEIKDTGRDNMVVMITIIRATDDNVIIVASDLITKKSFGMVMTAENRAVTDIVEDIRKDLKDEIGIHYAERLEYGRVDMLIYLEDV